MVALPSYCKELLARCLFGARVGPLDSCMPTILQHTAVMLSLISFKANMCFLYKRVRVLRTKAFEVLG